MKLAWPCPTCGVTLRAEPRHAGRHTKCPKCQTEVVVPTLLVEDDSPAAAPVASAAKPQATKAPAKPLSVQPSAKPAPAPAAQEADYSAVDFTAPEAAPVAEDEAEAEAATVPAAAAATGGDEEDFFSFTAATASAPKRAPAKAVEPLKSFKGKKQNKVNPAIWIGAGCAAAVVLLGAVLYFAEVFNSGASTGAQQPLADGPAYLVIDWPRDQRIGGRVIIDGGAPVQIADSGAIQYEIRPGAHQIKLQRGLDEISLSVNPKQSGEKCPVQWKSPSLSSEAIAEASTAPGGGVGFPTEKLIVDAVPELKKWETDLDAAKQKAATAKKDLLIVFFGADRRDWCHTLATQVLVKPEFRKYLEENFVPVLLEAKAESFEPGTARADWARQYMFKSAPTIVLADASGWAYGDQTYLDPEKVDYRKKLQDFTALRRERDAVAAGTESGSDDEKLAAAVATVEWLTKHKLLELSQEKLKSWQELADKIDPKNEKGQNEAIFMGVWRVELKKAFEMPESQRAQPLHAVADMFEKWKKDRKVKDPNKLAVLLVNIARYLDETSDEDGARTYLQLAKSCEPTEPNLRRFLDGSVGEGGITLSSGSGFAVADGGYIITNNHVVVGRGDLWVRITGEPKELPAELIATDPQRDIALIHLTKQPAAPLKPLPVSNDALGRGTDIVIFGYPLGDLLGGGVKLTKGAVTALPDKDRENMYLLDCTVNHGNSGGPMCDRYGEVVGLVSAKTIAGGEDATSYGMASPAANVVQFIQTKLPNFTAVEKKGPKLEDWAEVDKVVSPSVVMILKKK